MNKIDEAVEEYKSKWNFFNEDFDKWLSEKFTTIDTQAEERGAKKERERILSNATIVRTDYDEGLEVVFLSDIDDADPLPTPNTKQV